MVTSMFLAQAVDGTSKCTIIYGTSKCRLPEEDLKWERRGDEEFILGYLEFDIQVGHTGGNI